LTLSGAFHSAQKAGSGAAERVNFYG
jgi:hypothetical protein